MPKAQIAIGLDGSALVQAMSMRDALGTTEALQLAMNTFLTLCVLSGQTPSNLAKDMDKGVTQIDEYMASHPEVFGPKRRYDA